MIPLESAIFDLIRSSRGDVQPLEILLAEVRIRPEFADADLLDVNDACCGLARASKVWITKDGAKLRHQEPKREPQRRLF